MKKKKILSSVIVNAFFALTVFFFPCMEVFMNNYEEFTFPFAQTWWIMFCFSVLIVLLLTIIEYILPAKVILIFNMLVFSFSVCFYIQEIFLNGHLLLLDGKETIFTDSLKVTNLLIWLICFSCIAGLLFSKFKDISANILISVSLAIIFIQASGFTANLTHISDNIPEKSGYLTTEDEFTLGKDTNTIVFIVDSCSTDIVEDALLQDPCLFDSFTGFTMYPNMVSTYSRTYPALIYLLTGSKCDSDIPYNEYVNAAYDNSTFLQCIKDTGADIRIFTETSNVGGQGQTQISNFDLYSGKTFEIIRPIKFISQMLHISGYRGLPYIVKDRFKYNVSILNYLVRNLPDNTFMESDDITFFSDLKSHGIAISDKYESTFRLYHLWGAHAAPYLNENAESDSNTDQVKAFRGSIKIIREYLDYMKNNNLYGNSTIIITADHGDPYGNGNHEIDSERTCLFMVKTLNSKRIFSTSFAPISHENYFSTVLEGYGLTNTDFNIPAVYNVPVDCNEPRFYYYNPTELNKTDGSLFLKEYEIGSGDARNFENWKLAK